MYPSGRFVVRDLPEELDGPRRGLRQGALQPAELHVAAVCRRSRHGGEPYGRRRREDRRRSASRASGEHIHARGISVKRYVARLVLVAGAVVVRRHGVCQAACRCGSRPVGHSGEPVERKRAFVELRKCCASRDQGTAHHQFLHVITSLFLLQPLLRAHERFRRDSAHAAQRSRRPCARQRPRRHSTAP